ncbi:nuclear transport factor 2 family protein [Colwellia sp. E2M01]|uniref:nuclear transport factor 2 family protein n=1 Tax=Colwellia sp. E2M01 TaxID=2841561 RepID=UPI001C07FF11|nr:nuclear transport factor 2 family protein [Colwellia sp. E2M01]MBU2872110.1 nuclear transport factor 2 family protein [Colwellia sp. E2M01]
MQTNTNNNINDQLNPLSPDWLINFVDIYQTLSATNLNLLETIYHPSITFIDPMHKVEGINNLVNYFENLYTNLSCCDFVITNIINEGDEAAIYWTMTYQHSKLNKGEAVTVLGSSYIKGADDKVIYHRDYLDLGSMLYEQLPLIGKFIKWIKVKAAN